MYEYSEKALSLQVNLPECVDLQLDNFPVQYPYIPRISSRQAHFLIWWGTGETDPLLYEDSIRSKQDDPMFVRCDEDWKIEKGVAMLHIYQEEIIIGTLKTAGYMNRLSAIEIRKFLRKMWSELIDIFPDKKFIVPSGSLLEYIHLTMNQYRIPREPYHRELMQQFGFKRNGYYWIKE